MEFPIERVNDNDPSTPINAKAWNDQQDNIKAVTDELNDKTQFLSATNPFNPESIPPTIVTRELSSSITAPSAATTSPSIFDMGVIPTVSGYSYIGVINKNNGVADQWQISYGRYADNNKIYAAVQSRFGNSLTNTISCTLLYIKD